MKKLNFVLLSVAIAVSSFAQNNMAERRTSIRQQGISLKSVMQKTASAPRLAEGEPIMDTPSGSAHLDMYATSYAWGLGIGDPYTLDVDGNIGGVVEGEDGNLYIYNAISQGYIWFDHQPWIKAEKSATEENVYVVKTPQAYVEDAGDIYYVLRLVDNGDDMPEVDTNETDIRFEWKDGVLKQLDECYIGLCDETNDWYYMADKNIVYSPLNEAMMTGPTVDGEVYTLTYAYNAGDLTATKTREVIVFINNEEIYIRELYDKALYIFILGTINGNTATFGNRWYLGANEYYGGHVYALTANASVGGTATNPYFDFTINDYVSFTIDTTAKTLHLTYPSAFLINVGFNNLQLINQYVGLSNVENAIDNPTSSKEVSSVTYFDIAGRQVTTPARGIYVKRTTFADGLTTTEKVTKN